MNKQDYNFIDVFAGAGGLSEGFINAGFIPLAHIEKDKDACNSLRTRSCYHYLNQNNRLAPYYRYLKSEISIKELYDSVPETLMASVIQAKITNQTIQPIIQQIEKIIVNKNTNKIDLLVGGPPCQAYSVIGRARKNMENDDRNYLFRFYCEILDHFKPTMFVFENVPGLLSAGNGSYLRKMKRAFKDSGYSLDYKLLDAFDFGVMQRRKRIILVGWIDSAKGYYPTFETMEFHDNINDILQDLPKLFPGQEANYYTTDVISDYLSRNQIRTSDDILTWQIARNHMERDIKIYKRAILLWNKKQERLKYSDLPEHLATHKNKNSFLDRYKVVASDLQYSQTITAHIAKDGHYFIHPDFGQGRSLTVREAARIQSFPDSFFFEGSRTSAFTQIGNAVPPIMAKGIAGSIRKVLDNMTK